VKAAGKPVELLEAPNYAHLEMCESLGNPYGANGRAALAMMNLTSSCLSAVLGLPIAAISASHQALIEYPDSADEAVKFQSCCSA
jgi:hypothetical protein